MKVATLFFADILRVLGQENLPADDDVVDWRRRGKPMQCYLDDVFWWGPGALPVFLCVATRRLGVLFN